MRRGVNPWLWVALGAAVGLFAWSRSKGGGSAIQQITKAKGEMDKYTITPDYLPVPSKRRSGHHLGVVKFVVAHDTGNPGSTAAGNVHYYRNTANDISASAHIFVDDKQILECVPALTTDTPEKAWHVRYNAPNSNMMGAQANDDAIGVEYCYGGNINADEAYARYVWVLAYICHKYHLDPSRDIVGHFQLDPGRKTDPVSGLAASGRTFEQLKADVAAELGKF
jgi:N-acetylmuramoyl-L-alanine amidase